MHTEEPSSLAARRGRLWRGRVIAIIAIVCGGLAAPGTARAADPFGVAQEVNAAVAEATSAVQQAGSVVPQAASPAPQPQAKSWDAAAPASGASPANVVASAAGKALEAAAEEAASAAAVATAAVSGSTEPPLAASALAPTAPRARVKPHAHPRKARRVSSHSRRSVSVTLSTQTGEAIARASVSSSTSVVTGSARVERATGARTRRTNPAGVAPQHLPPVPLPPRDVTTSGQAGGQGPLMPLVVGALAAVVLFLVFELMRRMLSRPAIRRPRRISFPPWHPG